MALAVGILKDVDKLDLASMSQPEIEAHALPLQLLGLIVLSNQIRPESRDTITQLQEGYAHTTLAETLYVTHTKALGWIIKLDSNLDWCMSQASPFSSLQDKGTMHLHVRKSRQSLRAVCIKPGSPFQYNVMSSRVV